MSLELKSFRLGITAETNVALESVARAFGKDKASVLREVAHEWALKKLHEYRVASGLVHANGIERATDGDQRADAGTQRRGRQ